MDNSELLQIVELVILVGTHPARGAHLYNSPPHPLMMGNNLSETTSLCGGQPPAGLRTPCRNTPVAKRSGWVSAKRELRSCRKAPCAAKRKSCSGCFQSQNARVKNGDAPHITATTCFSGTRRGWGFCENSCAAKAAFVSRRGEGARMGGGDEPQFWQLSFIQYGERIIVSTVGQSLV